MKRERGRGGKFIGVLEFLEVQEEVDSTKENKRDEG